MPKVILGVKLYTMQETADLLGVRKGTITKYEQQGKITSATICRRKYFSEENIKHFLMRCDG